MKDHLTRFKKPCIYFEGGLSKSMQKTKETRDFDAIIQDDSCLLIIQ